jgi:hypothetical protein
MSEEEITCKSVSEQRAHNPHLDRPVHVRFFIPL